MTSSTLTQQKLALNIVEEQFGSTVKLVTEVLMRMSKGTFAEIKRRATLDQIMTWRGGKPRTQMSDEKARRVAGPNSHCSCSFPAHLPLTVVSIRRRMVDCRPLLVVCAAQRGLAMHIGPSGQPWLVPLLMAFGA